MITPVLPTYARADLAFERGEGAYLFTAEGERYLDFGAGIAVNAFGHAHPQLVRALKDQAEKLWHTSNLYRVPGQERLAAGLIESTFADTVFFCNSGAEAIECAIKMTRRYQSSAGRAERWRIITFEGAFHGRTLATIAAGGQAKYLEGFGPPVAGFDQVPFGDHAALEQAVTAETAGILIEPLQGEGGIRAVPPQCLRGLRALADKHDLVLIFDEVQTGFGRTGRLFAHEGTGAVPDVMAIAKALGGGFPVGACLANERVGAAMTAGTHGSTFGGNPLAMAVGEAALALVRSPGFLEHVRAMGVLLRQRLAALSDLHPTVFEEVRGEGLLIGLKMKVPNREFVAALLKEHLLTVPGGDNVVRLLPPLIITEREIDLALGALERAAAAAASAVTAGEPARAVS